MRETGFFFHAEGNDAARALPSRKKGLPLGALPLHAEGAFAYGNAEELSRLTEEIVNALATPAERLLAETRALSLSYLLELLSGYCGGSPAVTLPSRPYPEAMLAVCATDLLFCLGTVIHHALTGTFSLSVTAEVDADGAHLLLSVPSTVTDEAEAAARLGLTADRVAVLRGIAEAGAFSLSLITKDTAALRIDIPTCVPQYLPLKASDSDTFRAAFLLPLTYFSY